MSTAVKITLDVEVSVGVWNSSCTFEELRDQATREAIQKLNGLQDRGIKVVGNPRMKCVIMEEDKP